MVSPKISLRRLAQNNKTPIVPNPGTVTPVSVRSMTSSLSDDQLTYIDYKLRQYQRKEAEKAATPKQSIFKIVHKIKTKVTSVFKGKARDSDKEISLSAWNNDNSPTMSELTAPERGAMDVEDEQVNFQTRLAELRNVFSDRGTQDLKKSTSTHATHGNGEGASGLQGLLRDGPKMSKPTVEETQTQTIESYDAVICLEMCPLPENKKKTDETIR